MRVLVVALLIGCHSKPQSPPQTQVERAPFVTASGRVRGGKFRMDVQIGHTPVRLDQRATK